jgi:hypothetical protein
MENEIQCGECNLTCACHSNVSLIIHSKEMLALRLPSSITEMVVKPAWKHYSKATHNVSERRQGMDGCTMYSQG